jgi:hypothetical protein
VWILDPKDGHPEQGTVIWNGQASGVAVSGQYADWCPGEPNNWAGYEDAVVAKWNGATCWNDLAHTGTYASGYVAEYEPNQNSNPVYSDSMDIVISAPAPTTTTTTTTTIPAAGSGTETTEQFEGPGPTTGVLVRLNNTTNLTTSNQSGWYYANMNNGYAGLDYICKLSKCTSCFYFSTSSKY